MKADTHDDNSKFAIKLFSHFRKQEYHVFLKPNENGWSVIYYVEKFNDDKDCSKLIRYLNSTEGTTFPPGSSGFFIDAWKNLEKGTSFEQVKTNLQYQVT